MSDVGPRRHTCPKCSSTDILRIPRQGVMERLARLLGWNVYRCADCGTVFYDRHLKRTA